MTPAPGEGRPPPSGFGDTCASDGGRAEQTVCRATVQKMRRVGVHCGKGLPTLGGKVLRTLGNLPTLLQARRYRDVRSSSLSDGVSTSANAPPRGGGWSGVGCGPRSIGGAAQGRHPARSAPADKAGSSESEGVLHFSGNLGVCQV